MTLITAKKANAENQRKHLDHSKLVPDAVSWVCWQTQLMASGH